MEHTAATSLLSLEFQAICTLFVLVFKMSRNNKGVCFTYLLFGNFPDPRGLGYARTLRYAWFYPRQRQASLRGYYGGNPRTSPKNRKRFFEKFLFLSFSYTWEKTGARHKRLQYGAGRVMGPPTPPGYGTPSPPHAYDCL